MSVGLTERTKVLNGILRISDGIGSNLATAERTGGTACPRAGIVCPDPRGGGGGRKGPSLNGPEARDTLRLSTFLDDFLSGRLANGRLRVLVA